MHARHTRTHTQVDKDEVRLRRVIGLKKDEYLLDRKHVTCVRAWRACVTCVRA